MGGSESGAAVGSADGRGVSCTCARGDRCSTALIARPLPRVGAPSALLRGIGWAVGLHGWSTLEYPGVPWSTLEDLPWTRRTLEYP